MVLILRSPHMASVGTRPQSSAFSRLSRHFQALPTPQTIDPLHIHRPALAAQQSCDPPIAKPRPLPNQLQHPRHQLPLVVRRMPRVPLRAARLAAGVANREFTILDLVKMVEAEEAKL